MDFSAFDKTACEKEARKRWGETAAYREFEAKTADRSEAQEDEISTAFMQLFCELGALQSEDPAAPAVQAQIGAIRDFITAHYYTCTAEILQGLGVMYANDDAFRKRIDAAGGEGTAAFAARAIEVYCK